MIIVENRIIPFPGYKAITIWPFIFVRKGCKMSARDINHESIHAKQQLEMLWLPFFVWYLVEWVIRLFLKGNAYYNIGFEKEAYDNERKTKYLQTRKHFAWIKYL